MSKAPFVLVDGSSYLYRAFYAMPELTNSKGLATGAVKGVLNMLHSLIGTYGPSHIAVVFDAKGKTFRSDIYEDYKANRPPMPDALREQIEPLHQAVKALGLPLLAIPGVEADDVIGTLASRAAEKGIDTLISTGDKDMAQLVNQHTTLINTMNNTVMDEAGVEEKFGVRPDQIIDYLALMGDTSDNIPGVPKCGPKTAVKWIKEYGSFQGVLDSADQVKGKVGENLRDSLEFLPMSYELATIKLDVELEEDYDNLMMIEPDLDELKNLYEALEFKSWLALVEEGKSPLNKEATGKKPTEGKSPAKAKKAAINTQYDVIYDQKDLTAWVKKLSSAKLIAFDTETTGLNYMQADLVGVSFCCEAGKAAYVPVAHDYEGAPEQISLETMLSELKPILENAKIKKVGQHIKFDQNIMARYDVHIEGIAYDTMLESYVYNSVATRHDMDSLARAYLDLPTVKFEDIAGKGVKQLTFNQIDLEKAGPYAAEDADITFRLHEELWARLQETPSLEKVFTEIEMPLVDVLSDIERNGVLIDAKKLKKQSEKLEELLADLEKQAHELAGEAFNLNSPKQLGVILYEKLEIPVKKKTKTGQPSTAEPVLQELAYDHELPALLLEYRSFAKLKSTYTDVLPTLIDSNTGRVHTSYHQAVAATGRLSSTDPNLQNIPIRNEEGRKIRQAFIADKGYKILAADYSQIELRIMAHLSEDESLIKAFKAGEDIHRATAAEVLGITSMEVTDEERRSAKAVNFGLIYGMSAFGLARQLGIGRHDAQDYINLYFDRYPGVKRYMDDIRINAAEKGYVETIFGRRLYLPMINDRNGMRRQAAERTAINAPMQGSAADIIKKAMLKVDAWLKKSQLDAKVIMQVHDELVLEVNEKDVKAVTEGLKKEMGNAAKLSIPLIVDVGQGKNWDEAH